MCGFCAILAPTGGRLGMSGGSLVERMTGTLAHRGPDRAATWSDEAAGIALGHTRLSILDLSAAGDQPMHSPSGRFVISFNGEIYNYADLRDELAKGGAAFRGTSDTEVLLTGFDEWGIVETLRRSTGMFAFAVWDRSDRRLLLARDRAGEKPLYYGWQGASLLCGSELKALRAHPDFLGTIDRDALTLFLRYNYVPSPRSIFVGIHKLPPGTFLWIDPERPGVLAAPQPYWSLESAVGSRVTPGTDEKSLVDQLDRLLRDSVRRQMVADVPVGAFLSGGVDSSLLVALMQSESRLPVQTFTIGYGESAYDESPYARAVAAHLGTHHTELRVTPDDAMGVIAHLPRMYDEPFADSSQIPTHLVSALTRQTVTVALSGDGADELFGGYDRYYLGPRLWRSVERIPRPARRLIANSLERIRPTFLDAFDALATRARRGGAGGSGRSRSRERVAKLADVLRASDAEAVRVALASIWANPERVVLNGHEPRESHGWSTRVEGSLPLEERMMYADFLGYLPDDILVKVDRASMAVSLETRAPFLDHAIIEFAWSLPLSMKLRGRQRKQILRSLLARYVPPRLTNRPKMGFAVPVGQWIREPLRPWADELLDEDRLRDAGFFDPAAVRATWIAHRDGRVDATFALWGVLMFEAWRETLSCAPVPVGCT